MLLGHDKCSRLFLLYEVSCAASLARWTGSWERSSTPDADQLNIAFRVHTKASSYPARPSRSPFCTPFLPDFFRVFSLGDLLRQGGPVKVFEGAADVDGERSAFTIKRVRKWKLKKSEEDELFREVEHAYKSRFYRTVSSAIVAAVDVVGVSNLNRDRSMGTAYSPSGYLVHVRNHDCPPSRRNRRATSPPVPHMCCFGAFGAFGFRRYR